MDNTSSDKLWCDSNLGGLDDLDFSDFNTVSLEAAEQSVTELEVNELITQQDIYNELCLPQFDQDVEIKEAKEEASPGHISQTVGNRSIKQLLSSPPQYMNETYKNIDLFHTDDKNEVKPAVAAPVTIIPSHMPTIDQLSYGKPANTNNLQTLLTQPKQPVNQQQQQHYILTTTTPNTQPNNQILQNFTTTPIHIVNSNVVTSANQLMSASISPKNSFLQESPPNNVILVQKVPIDRVTTTATTKSQSKPAPKSNRSAHNAIEKRYRASINKRIQELQELLFPNGSEQKLSKASILERAIRQIKYYRTKNESQQKKINWLQNCLSKAGNIPGEMVAKEPTMYGNDMMGGLPSPPDSIYGSPSYNGSPSSSYVNSSPDYMMQDSPPRNQDHSTFRKMSDNKRFVLCLVTCMIFSILPIGFDGFSQAAPNLENNHHGGERTILGVNQYHSQSTWLPTFCKIGVKFVLTVMVLMQYFVFWDPVTEKNSKANHRYNSLREKANEHMRKGNYEDAATTYHSCLETLGRPLPKTKVDKVFCLLLNLIRWMLWFINIPMFSLKLYSENTRQNVRMSARLAAQIYHRLDQLSMTNKTVTSRMDGAIYSLCAINLCEVAGWKLTPPDVAVRIYATAALRFKMQLPPFMSRFVSWYLISRSRNVLMQYSTECDDELKWLGNKAAINFLLNWNLNVVETDCSDLDFSVVADKEDPLSHAAFHFRNYLLQKALYLITMPCVVSGSYKEKKFVPPCQMALQYIQLVKQCEEDEMDELEDEEESKYWLNVATAACHFYMGEYDKATGVEQLPASLEYSKNELPKAVKHAFIAYKEMLQYEGSKGNFDFHGRDVLKGVLETANKASQLLRDDIVHKEEADKQVLTAYRLIATEWLLKTRTLLWEQTSANEGRRAPLEQLEPFERDLMMLQNILVNQPNLQPKITMYEATLRMMANSNPLKTQKLLMGNLKKRRPTYVSRNDTSKLDYPCGDYDRALSSIQACKHLPSPPMLQASLRKEELLKEASQIMCLFGDKVKMNTANRLMKPLVKRE